MNVTDDLLRRAGVVIENFDERQLCRMRACLRDRIQHASTVDRACKMFRKDMDWVMGVGVDPKSMLKRRLISAITQTHCTECIVFERCLEVAVDDLFGSSMKHAIDAHKYFFGSVFDYHCSLLGINSRWAREVVSCIMNAANWNWSDKMEDNTHGRTRATRRSVRHAEKAH